MIEEIIYKPTIFYYKGFKCVVLEIFDPYLDGWINGYVGIPEGHRLYKKSYENTEEIQNLDIHGGITFSSNRRNPDTMMNDGLWYLGFDTAHGDDFDFEYVVDHNRSLMTNRKHNKDKDFVISEIKKLVNQLQ